ncbi:MAG: glutamate-1-semialdehyde 2,1-aminomutase [Nitrospirota bacterium]|nr:glutamate-1-semialdehyde 2,1-aminomutase [Nitrospirota bacterium]
MNSEEGYRKARLVFPGGVSSPVRAYQAVGGHPPVIREGKGAFITDVDGHEYIDFVLSFGPLILGHADPEVVEAVCRTAAKGMSFGGLSEPEIALGEVLTRAIPGLDRIRFVNSGTEAAMSALRLARAFTGRNRIVKFAGGYHGHSDALLVKAGSGGATFGIPTSAGVPESVVHDTIVLPYNDTDALRDYFRREGKTVAALILEPVAGNMGVVPPDEEFLLAARTVTEENGALLIADEVITGFRLTYGGAQVLFGMEPDLTLLGKIIGGGMPVGAYGGREDIMKMIAPEGPVYQAGTLSGNPVAMAAGLATLTRLRTPALYSLLEEKSRILADGILAFSRSLGLPLRVNRMGSMMTLFFSDKPVTDLASAEHSSTKLFSIFHQEARKEGLLLPPSQFEALFLSTCHDDQVVAKALPRFKAALERTRALA